MGRQGLSVLATEQEEARSSHPGSSSGTGVLMTDVQFAEDFVALQQLEQVEKPTAGDKITLVCILDRHEDAMFKRCADLAISWGYSPSMLQEECYQLLTQDQEFYL